MTEQEKQAIVDVLGRDDKQRYYVYALIDPRNNQVFYIGKGQKDRVWQYELESEDERQAILSSDDLTVEERNRQLADICSKHKVINEIGKENVQKVIIKWGLTSDEAYAAESALINLYKYQEVELTNIQNGHASEKEKGTFKGITEALSVGDYLKENAKLKKFADLLAELEKKGKRALFVNIVNSYKSYMTESEIADCARSSWDVNRKVDYVFAMNNSVVRGVYMVEEMYKGFKKDDGVINRSRLANAFGADILYRDRFPISGQADYEQIYRLLTEEFTEKQKHEFCELIGNIDLFIKEVDLG